MSCYKLKAQELAAALSHSPSTTFVEQIERALRQAHANGLEAAAQVADSLYVCYGEYTDDVAEAIRQRIEK